MKKILAISTLAAAAVFSGCTNVTVDIPDEKYAGEATWTRRTLENVRYYNHSVQDVKYAAIKAARDLELYYAGTTPFKYGEVLYFCGPKFVKITIDITRRTPKPSKNSNVETLPEYTEVAIVYGTMGDLEASQKFVAAITKNLK